MGNRITPSYVAFTPDERLVGDAAKAQYAANPTNTIFDIKYGLVMLFANSGVSSVVDSMNLPSRRTSNISPLQSSRKTENPQSKSKSTVNSKSSLQKKFLVFKI